MGRSYARLEARGYRHKTVCHGRGEYARDEDGDGCPGMNSTFTCTQADSISLEALSPQEFVQGSLHDVLLFLATIELIGAKPLRYRDPYPGAYLFPRLAGRQRNWREDHRARRRGGWRDRRLGR